jgi:hypothetical protein
MAITETDEEPVRSTILFGYAIKMMCGDQIVPVLVTDEALQKFPSPPVELLERLRKNRRPIEEIASGKHSDGQIVKIENYEIVCVTSADVRR